MYGIYHVDKWTKYLLQLTATEGEAVNYVLKAYSGRFQDGKDFVHIVDNDNKVIYEYGVMYMPQFEAKQSWDFPSKSNPSNSHRTLLTLQGMMSCSCQGWVFRKKDKVTGQGLVRNCKHIKEIIAREKFQVEERGQYLFVVSQHIAKAKAILKKTPEAVFARLIAAYETAIDYMASLDPNDMLQAIPAVEEAKFKVEIYMTKLEGLGIDGSAEFASAQSKLKTAIQR